MNILILFESMEGSRSLDDPGLQQIVEDTPQNRQFLWDIIREQRDPYWAEAAGNGSEEGWHCNYWRAAENEYPNYEDFLSGKQEELIPNWDDSLTLYIKWYPISIGDQNGTS